MNKANPILTAICGFVAGVLFGLVVATLAGGTLSDVTKDRDRLARELQAEKDNSATLKSQLETASKTKEERPSGNVAYGDGVVERATVGALAAVAGIEMQPESSPRHITMNDYKQISPGMSYDRVRKMLGSRGEESARTHVDGIEGVSSAKRIVIYTWSNPDGSAIKATFENELLTSKAQAGLK